ncbi:MAG: hypothetical protein WCL21_14635 [Mariniphaga sp.]
MEKLIMQGKVLVRYIDDDENAIHDNYLTSCKLYKDIDGLLRIVFDVKFPNADIDEEVSIHILQPVEDEGKHRAWNSYAVKLSERELIVQFSMFEIIELDTNNYFVIGRLQGRTDFEFGGNCLYDLSETAIPANR